ncbi:glycoside hydrolase family 3 C-terminal domain-containing protein [Actinomadura sp. 9N407]|uniref:glycoside hydrolase family 3 C-terminal domain-containing protein n=1 Tax=Actinomadura sp. 9N407 TaxID=3375154 RepID=UPI0037A85075
MIGAMSGNGQDPTPQDSPDGAPEASASGTQPAEEISAVVAGLSLEDKASLLTGAAWFDTLDLAEAGVPALRMADGPHGLRLSAHDGKADHLGLSDSRPATCFPPAVALASSWDASLAGRVGAALARECLSAGVGVLLGPGINIKRSPLCGRNFEYFSEDPVLTGVLGAAWVDGLQERGVGASLKHFAVNSQETERMTVSADVDTRTLHEIYLRAFRHIVTRSRPWTVMCSYNRINGVHASQDPWLLTELLREQWGFDGLVVSDWGAVLDRVRALAAGLDLEMPDNPASAPLVVDAVNQGLLDPDVLDTGVARLASLSRRAAAVAETAREQSIEFDTDAHHALAREVAARSIVLLKNDGAVLPLDPDAAQTIAVIGEFARTPRYQGGGSSHVTPTRLDNALDAIRDGAPGADVVFAPGFGLNDSEGPEAQAALTSEAVAAAENADVAVLFLGLPESYESEGYDRKHLELPAVQTDLLDAVLAANRETVVVLSNGGVVRVSGWADRVRAVLETWLLGQAGGPAIADVLFGTVNPSGRLTETIPVALADTPAYLDFPGEFGRVAYGEGIHVGYRYFDARGLAVSFPFGHGLSYTTFAYDDLRVTTVDGRDIEVSVRVTNTGRRSGREVVQVYVAAPGSKVRRPIRELKGFAVTAELEPGQARDVTVRIDHDALAYYDPAAARWQVEGLEYVVEVGASSRDIRLSVPVTLAGDEIAAALSGESTLREWLDHPVGGPLVTALLNRIAERMDGELDVQDEGLQQMIAGLRLSQFVQFSTVPVTADDVAELVAAAGGPA